MGKIERQNTFNANDADVRECIQRGWDPPIKWRFNEGRTARVRAGSTGGFNIVGRQAPEMPPGRAGAASSVSLQAFLFSMGFPPWRGFPCQLPGGIDMCGSSDGKGGDKGGYAPTTTPPPAAGGGTPSCAAGSDTTGTFGKRQSLSPMAALPLACGGSMPLSTYSMTLAAQAGGVYATEAGSRTGYAYLKSATGFTPVKTRELPTHLCNDAGKQTTTVTKPVAQIITYNTGSASVAIRLQGTSPSDVIDPFDPDPDAQVAHYLVVPLRGGIPDIPDGCPSERSYLRTSAALTAPLVVEPSTTPGCEGDSTACSGKPITPTTNGVCDSATLYPNSAACANMIQFVPLDRPNFVYPPNSNVPIAPMTGRTAYIATTVAGSRLYTQKSTLIYFGTEGGSFVLPEGGTMKLSNGQQLVMNGPATVNAYAHTVILTAGGSITAPDGTLAQSFAENSSYAPTAALPYAVKINRSLELPAGYAAPTMPQPYVRLPVVSQ